MTELEALVKSVKIWTYLAETGSQSKADAYEELGLQSDRSDCPLCEHAYWAMRRDSGMTMCEYCPLYGMWVAGDRCSTCVDEDTAFTRWGVAYEAEQSKKAAYGMVDLLKLRISQLEKQQ